MHVFFGTPYPKNIISFSPQWFFGNVFWFGSIFFNMSSNSMKFLLLHPYLAFKWTKSNTTDNRVKFVHSGNKTSSNHFVIYHTNVHFLVEKTLVQHCESCPLIDLPCVHQHAQFRTRLVFMQLTMPYSSCITWNNPIADKMCLYVIFYMLSLTPTFNIGT